MLIIQSEWTEVASQLSEQIRSITSMQTSVQAERTWRYELCHDPQMDLSKIEWITHIIHPLKPPVNADSSLATGAAVLYLGSSQQREEFRIVLTCEGEALQAHLAQELSRSFPIKVRAGAPHRSVLRYGGAPSVIVDWIAWLCAQSGVEVEREKLWGEDELDLHLSVCDPNSRGLNFRANLPLTIYVDTRIDSPEVIALITRVREGGYNSLEMIETPDIAALLRSTSSLAFLIHRGAFKIHPDEWVMLKEVFSKGMDQLGIDRDVDPLIEEPFFIQETETPNIQIVSPIGAWRRDEVRPRAGSSPSRWTVRLSSDQPPLLSSIVQLLKEQGFWSVEITQEALSPSISSGVELKWNSAIQAPSVQNIVRRELSRALSVHGPVPVWIEEPRLGMAPSRQDHKTLEDFIQLSICFADFQSDVWLSKLNRMASRCRLSLSISDQRKFQDIQSLQELTWREFNWIAPDQLETSALGWLFDSPSKSLEDQELPLISYGDAPLALVEWLVQALEEKFGISLEAQKSLPAGDDEIIIEWLEG